MRKHAGIAGITVAVGCTFFCALWASGIDCGETMSDQQSHGPSPASSSARRNAPVTKATRRLDVSGADEAGTGEPSVGLQSSHHAAAVGMEDFSPPESAPTELVLYTLETAFNGDDVGGRESYIEEVTFRETLAPLLTKNSTLDSVVCKRSACRLVSTQEDMASYLEFVHDVGRSGMCRECFWTNTGETADGRPVLTMFFAREGTSLARAP